MTIPTDTGHYFLPYHLLVDNIKTAVGSGPVVVGGVCFARVVIVGLGFAPVVTTVVTTVGVDPVVAVVLDIKVIDETSSCRSKWLLLFLSTTSFK